MVTAMPMTVSEIADQVVQQGPSRETFIERVHYWTRERLISPVGKRNPGTGRHRVYPGSVIQDAVVLNAMADAGIPIAAQRLIMGTVRAERHLGWRVKEEAKSGINFFLVIETYGNHSTPYFKEAPEFKINDLADRTIVFNLTRLFAAVQDETGGTNG